jgi:hypothetical protein
MSQSRQPKGIREGGQFAESKNPEPDVDLAHAPRPVASMDEIIRAVSDLESYYISKDTSDLDEGMHVAINNLLSLRLPDPLSGGSSLAGLRRNLYRHGKVTYRTGINGGGVERTVEGYFVLGDRRNRHRSDGQPTPATPSIFWNEFGNSGVANGRLVCPVDGFVKFEPTVDSDLPMDRRAIADRLHQEFDMPGDTSAADRFEPNDFGARLVRESSLEIENEEVTPQGIKWSGRLSIGAETLEVENYGDGAPNDYLDGLGGNTVFIKCDEWNLLLEQGFPKLDSANALDDFCTILNVAKTP